MFYGWYVVGACCFIMMYGSGAISLGFTAIFEPLVDEFGWSHTQISFAASLRGLERGLFAPVAGVLSERWGPNFVVFGGLLLCSIGLILLSTVTSITMFYISFIIIGIGITAIATPLMMVFVLSWFPNKGGLAMGIAASGVALGGLLVPIITYLIDLYGWRHAILIMGLGMLVLPLPLSLLLRKNSGNFGNVNSNQESLLSFDYGHSSLVKSKEISFGAKDSLTNFSFWIITSAFFCQSLVLSGVLTHIMPYLSSIGIDRTSSGLVAGALPLSTVLGRVGFGWLMDRVEKRKLVAISFALNSLGVLILAIISPGQNLLIILFIILFGVGWGGSVVMFAGLMNSYFGIKRLGTIIGFAGVFIMIGYIIGAPLTGWIFDRWGYYQPSWFALAAIVGFGTLFFVTLKNPSNVITKAA